MNVLICVSNMPYAANTVELGSMMAQLLGHPISLLKVIAEEEEKETAVSTLDTVRQYVHAPVEETAVSLGTPSTEILSRVEGGHYSLVVLGAHITENLWDQFLQSVTHKVADQASTSVLVVRGEAKPLRNLLICTSGHPHSEIVIRNGAALAKLTQAKVTLLHVTESPPGMYTGLDEMEETLPELLQSNTPLAQHLKWASEYMVQTDVPAKLKLRHGIALDELLAEAQETPYDLLVIGTQDEHKLLNHLFMGQLTPKIIDNAPSSVLVVRGDL